MPGAKNDRDSPRRTRCAGRRVRLKMKRVKCVFRACPLLQRESNARDGNAVDRTTFSQEKFSVTLLRNTITIIYSSPPIISPGFSVPFTVP